jgi:hypothetical protein
LSIVEVLTIINPIHPGCSNFARSWLVLIRPVTAVSGHTTEIAARFDDLRAVEAVAKASRHDQIPIAASGGGSVQ